MPADKLAGMADQMLQHLSQEHTASKHALIQVMTALNITPAPAKARLSCLLMQTAICSVYLGCDMPTDSNSRVASKLFKTLQTISC